VQDRRDLLAIIDAHRCIPDEATLAAALRAVPGEYVEYTADRLAAAIVARLRTPPSDTPK
jgi:hypothetical protein